MRSACSGLCALATLAVERWLHQSFTSGWSWKSSRSSWQMAALAARVLISSMDAGALE